MGDEAADKDLNPAGKLGASSKLLLCCKLLICWANEEEVDVFLRSW